MLGRGVAERCHVGDPPFRVRTCREFCPRSLGNLGQRERPRHGEEAWIGHQYSSKVSAISGYASFSRPITRSVRLNSATANIDS